MVAQTNSRYSRGINAPAAGGVAPGGVTLNQVRGVVFARTSNSPFATLAAANAAGTWPVPAGQGYMTTTALGEVLVAYAGATSYTVVGAGSPSDDALFIIQPRPNATEGVAPTAAELQTANNNVAPTLGNGDDAQVILSNGTKEWWTFQSGAWSLARTDPAVGARTYRAPAVSGTLRTTAPLPSDLSVTSWSIGSIIRRRLTSGIEQEWLTTSTTACVLEGERKPDEEDPLLVFPASPVTPGSAAANGWVAGDVFVFRNTLTTPISYEICVWTAVGVSIQAVKQSYSGSGSGTTQADMPRVYRASPVAGTQRQTAPLPVDVGATAFVAGTLIKRRLDSGIEQEYIVNATGVAIIDNERPPDDANPLTTFPISPAPIGNANGWLAGDRFVFRNATTSPATYEVCEWTVVGPNLVAIKQQ